MILPRFEYHEPSTLDEACQIMAELKDKGRPLGGGTDLIVNMRKGTVSPENVISLARIEELKKTELSKKRLSIGACVTAAELAESSALKKAFDSLTAGAGKLGSPLIRNLATIGGNLVTARPAADFPPPLLAYDAEIVINKSSGDRTIPLDEFFAGPGETVMGPDEILTEIVIAKPPLHSGAAYLKLGARKTLVIGIVNVAAFLALDGPEGAVKSARVVLGSVAPTPLRAATAEKALVGEKPNDALFEKAATAAAGDSRPIDDFRGSAEYRRAMVEVLTRRALHEAYAKAQKNT
jgi:carbon-monoxide dehydrogenase medium subunit